MARFSGRNMAVYLSVDGTAAATSLPFMAEYEIDSSSDQIETTAGGDTNKTYVPGLPDFSGSISGFYDSALTQTTDALWRASRDGVARGFYLYPDSNTPALAFYGLGYFDFNIKAGVGGATAVSSKIMAAGNIYRKP